ncbi:cysteine desulfurase [Salinisphaera sp. W335]|uniref:Probable cysteine desulfurase n=1 Tax=Spectribacter hydrogenoxidans TaxID=3075608 RepID=A0ABU3C2K0_9GAMM|nr:cysteine desulfurase [Salinisphaera sp. W335]MDT0635616.1 cysteine desulfurase [Salinisphaera sp. W335]
MASDTATRLPETHLDVAALRAAFPVLDQRVHDKPLVYLDNAATTQKPAAVIDAVANYYRHDNANVHRGVHVLSQRATEAYEGAREAVAGFINAEREYQIVFTRGTTEAINLVAQSYARPRLQPGDEILITEIEHHSNIVPWQLVCEATGATLRVARVNDAAEIDRDDFAAKLGERTRLVAIGHVSNAFGTIHPVNELIALAHRHNIPVLVDGAQATAHMPVDVRALNADFYVFSGHKLFGPTGIGVLYGRESLLEAMPPYQGGGDMIETVTLEGSTWNELPAKFEAGTPNIAGAIGLGAAIRFLADFDLDAIAAHEEQLRARVTAELAQIDGLRLIGTAGHKAAILSFVMGEAHPQDIATILDSAGVAIRAGHHCAMPGMARFGLEGTARASFAAYNDESDVDALLAGLRSAQRIFA